MNQLNLLDEFDPAVGLTRQEWATCAQWALDHRRASAWVEREGRRINLDGRAVSWRLDIDPHLAANARAYGLDGGLYSGCDHNLSALLARYYMATRFIRFRVRARAGDHVKNATPECAA